MASLEDHHLCLKKKGPGQRGKVHAWTLEWSLRGELGWRVLSGVWKEFGLCYSEPKFKQDMAG